MTRGAHDPATGRGGEPTGGAAPRLRLRGVAKHYGQGASVGPVDLELPGGALVLVLGANGAGKSTLLGAIAGTLRHEGEVTLDGSPARARERRRSYLPQRIRLPAGATVGEALDLFGALATHTPAPGAPEQGFLPPPERRLGELSGGQAQRVALVAALLGSPALVVLDEPFANLDDPGRAEALRLILAHRDAGALVLVASPMSGDLLTVADHVIHVRDGRVTGPERPSRADIPPAAGRSTAGAADATVATAGS